MVTLQDLRKTQEQNNIPIIKKPLEDFLSCFIKEKNITSILEIGGACAYSSIFMASLNKDITITSLEKDEVRFTEGIKNIKDFNLEKQINFLNDDALTIDIKGSFDLIFIDAAKSANIKYFEKFSPLLKKGGYIIVDNLGFHGFVKDSTGASKNVLRIVSKIKDFINFLENNQDFKTEILEIGDTISLSWREEDEHTN